MKEYERVITELNKLGIREKLLARRLNEEKGWYQFGRREFEHMNKTEDKLYSTFLRLVDEETKNRLLTIDAGIKKIESTIYERTGWWRTSTGFRFENNFINMQDPEFRSWDTYTISRNENGYYVNQEEPFNGYFKSIQETEKRFFEKYKDLLQQLHLLLTEKENIMRGNFKLKDESNRDLALNISTFLGFIKEEKKNTVSK